MSSKLIAVFVFLALMRTLAQTVITLAGGGANGTESGSINGVGTAALFNQPSVVALDSVNALYVVAESAIRLMYPNRTVIMLAGGGANGSTAGFIDGDGTAALFSGPSALAVGASGALYVVDSGNHKLRQMHPNLTVITLAGGNSTGNTPGSTDGKGTAALFNFPFGAAVGASGNVIVADRTNHKIRLIYPNLTVITLAGGSSTGNTQGSTNGVGTAALFSSPYGVATNTAGAVYVLDTGNSKIRLIYPNLTVITLAGGSTSGFLGGSTNGIGTAALFGFPRGFAVDAVGAVYVAEAGNHKVRLIYPNCSVTTLAGGGASGTTAGFINGDGTAALFSGPRGIAMDALGIIYIADRDNQVIRLIYPFTCSPGTFANFTSRSCIMCLPGSFSNTSSAESCSFCVGGTFAKPFGSISCEACPAGHACPPGTSSWARLNCGRGNYCPDGSAEPIPCPIQIVPVPYASWASHPLTAQGPAFLVETSACLNHCFWNFTSGDGMLSKC